mmetsp:Transcript_564/g.1122  ORF Transcript_564/g.1122 Transcript_564/m.1122 type:complete len:132 (-) Transcript_564:660-1055(-)
MLSIIAEPGMISTNNHFCFKLYAIIFSLKIATVSWTAQQQHSVVNRRNDPVSSPIDSQRRLQIENTTTNTATIFTPSPSKVRCLPRCGPLDQSRDSDDTTTTSTTACKSRWKRVLVLKEGGCRNPSQRMTA